VNNRKLKVLVVEDSQEDTKLIQKDLKQGGKFTLVHGISIQSTLRHLSAGNVDAVLLNLSFPGSLGLEILGQIHKFDGTIPIIALARIFEESECLKALKLGAQDYFPLHLSDSSGLAKNLFYLCECHRFGIVPKRSYFATKLERQEQVVRGAERRVARPEGRLKGIL
jgi:CheY-like chemotaxis protein